VCSSDLNLTEALCLLDQSKLIREKLVASAPLHYSRQRAFALLLRLQGELTLEKGDRDKALHFFARSRSIWEHLVSSRPSDIVRQGNLSIALDRLGLLAKLRGDVTEASGLRNLSQKYYQAVMAGAIDAQAELVEPLIELGQIAEKQGEFAEAIRFFTQSKAICERVVASDPTEIWAKKKLTESHCYITKLA
jgi:tetratricopeptide (TPR) repeat protein